MPFRSIGLHADILRGVSDLGFSQPTAIQKDAIPAGLAGRDVLACSATGSGKTAAFGLPILNRLVAKPRGTTRALIITPTRELATQIVDHLSDLAKHTRLSIAAIYGGVGMGSQRQALQRGVDIVVATPGRLLDHLQNTKARLHGVEVLVLDEADRMLDMGFMPDIRRILQCLPKQRQTLFFSATMPGPIVSLTRELLANPVVLNIERQGKPAAGVRQSLYPVPQSRKSSLLLKLMKNESVRNALIFTRTKRRADRVADYLKRNGLSAALIHGDRTQSQRTQAMDGFKSGRYRVLVATDVAARGIDVDALSHVINFDLPATPEDYVHRVGRTARATATGDAFTFVTPEEERDLKAIERALAAKLPRVIVAEFDYTAVEPDGMKRGGHGEKRGDRSDHPSKPWHRGRKWRGKKAGRSHSARPWEQADWKKREPHKVKS
jgi:ATP-dependent RNA helicase RhlE